MDGSRRNNISVQIALIAIIVLLLIVVAVMYLGKQSGSNSQLLLSQNNASSINQSFLNLKSNYSNAQSELTVLNENYSNLRSEYATLQAQLNSAGKTYNLSDEVTQVFPRKIINLPPAVPNYYSNFVKGFGSIPGEYNFSINVPYAGYLVFNETHSGYANNFNGSWLSVYASTEKPYYVSAKAAEYNNNESAGFNFNSYVAPWTEFSPTDGNQIIVPVKNGTNYLLFDNWANFSTLVSVSITYYGFRNATTKAELFQPVNSVSYVSLPNSTSSYTWASGNQKVGSVEWLRGNSITLTLPRGYRSYICAGASTSISSYSWVTDAYTPNSNVSIGHQSQNVCALSTDNQTGQYKTNLPGIPASFKFGADSALAGIGINASNYNLTTMHFGSDSGLNNVTFHIKNNDTYVALALSGVIITNNSWLASDYLYPFPANPHLCNSTSVDQEVIKDRNVTSVTHANANLTFSTTTSVPYYLSNYASITSCGPLMEGNYTMSYYEFPNATLAIYQFSRP